MQKHRHPEVIIHSPAPAIGHPLDLLRDLFRDVSAGRQLAWRLFMRDLKSQYRQTYFGYLWAFLPPLVASLTFIFLQSQGITNINGTGIPYPAFALMGTLLWQTFVDAVQSPLNSLTKAKPMLAKINFPREAILMAGVYMVVFNFLVRLCLIIAVMLIWQVYPSTGLVLFPVGVAGLILCGLAFGMMLIPLGGLYGDVAKSIPILSQFWMLLTPVVYPARSEGLAGWLAIWNPVAPLMDITRSALTDQTPEHFATAIFVIVCSAAVSFAGVIVFRLVMPHLIERMGG